MKRVIIIISLFIGFNTVSCQTQISKTNDTKEDAAKICLSLDMDSILVEYYSCGNKYSKYYISFDNNDKIVVRSKNNVFRGFPTITFTVDSLDLIKQFVVCINKLYLDKTEKIILERKKTNLMIDSEYPSFYITSYKNGKKIVNESTIFSDNELFVFNPLFHEFHELTRLLVKFVDDELEK